MKFSRKGSSIFMVLAILAVFFTMAMGLLRHSSGEMRVAKQQIGYQSADIIALSGIDYAENRLRKNRWYQKPFSKDGSEGRPTFVIENLTPPGGEGKLTIACQDVAKKTPATNIFGMQQLWLLQHIDVFSLGEFAGKKSLVYGRYIISPEPALNSDSTDGFIYTNANLNPYMENVQLPEPKSGNLSAAYILKKILVYSGQKVNLNTIVALVDAEDGSATGIPVYSSSHGKVTSIVLAKGETCLPGDVLLTLEKKPSSGSAASLKTLKKMVRITKIDLGLFPDFNLESLSDRIAVSEYVAQSSDAYLLNFVSHKGLKDAVGNIKNQNLPEKLSSKDLLALFPPDINNVTKERAENLFLTYLLQNFVPPGANWEKKDKAMKEAFLQLDHIKTAPPKDMVDFLSKNGIQWTLNSKPRVDERYYAPKMYKGRFLQLLSPKFNLPANQFVEQLSWLRDATRAFDIQEKEDGFGENSTIKENETSIYIVKNDADPHPIKVEVQKIKKPYSYVDPVNDFTIQMQDLVEFFRKYYSSSDTDLPKEDKRYLAHIDWPLPDEPGPAPKPPEGYKSVWIPGIPGEPPGLPTWDYKGGKKVKIPYPTSSSRAFEPSGGNPNAGEKKYPISRTETDSSGDKDFSEGKDFNTPEAPFSTAHPPITYERDGTWKGTPGKAGVPPKQGKWDYAKIPDPPTNDAGATTHVCSSCCFAPGTLILMADGSSKKIEDVLLGDIVKSFNSDNEIFAEGTVTKLESPTRDHLTTIIFENDAELKLTNEHPLLTKDGWASIDPQATLTGHNMKVKTLRVSSQVLDADSEWVKIRSIFTESRRIKVYNLAQVEPFSTFLAGQFVAHNKPDSQFENTNPGNGSSGGEGATTATSDQGPDGTDAGGNEQNLGAPGSGNGGNISDSGQMPGNCDTCGKAINNNSNTDSTGSNSSGSNAPGDGSGSSTSNTANTNPAGGDSGSSNSGSSSGTSGSGYPSSGSPGNTGGGSSSSFSRSSSFSI